MDYCSQLFILCHKITHSHPLSYNFARYDHTIYFGDLFWQCQQRLKMCFGSLACVLHSSDKPWHGYAPGSCCFALLIPGCRIDAWGWLRCRIGAKIIDDPQGQCNSRRGAELSPCSCPRCRLNPCHQPVKPCVCGILEWTMSVPTTEISLG